MSLMMTTHPYQADPNYMHSLMNFRACVKLPLDIDGIDAIINTQILKTPYDILVHLVALDHVRNPDIGALKKEKEDIIFQNATQKVSKQSSCDI